MRTVHIANTNFELELAGERNHPPQMLQLYFLPLLYADKNDAIAWPYDPFDPADFQEVASWGASLEVAKWADQKGLKYVIPNFEVVRQVNSKEFTYLHAPKLPGEQLLGCMDEVLTWIKQMPGEKVLKTCYGLSGRGHLFDLNEKLVRKEFDAGRPIIGQPWVKRSLDFSTQWQILPSGEIRYLGVTQLENAVHGSYLGTIVGGEPIFFLEEHKKVALGLLQKVAMLGYFGYVGLDAMVYDEGILHPIVEMNARRTLGLSVLQFQQKNYPGQKIGVRFEKNVEGKQGLLPSKARKNQQEIVFPRNLFLKIFPFPLR